MTCEGLSPTAIQPFERCIKLFAFCSSSGSSFAFIEQQPWIQIHCITHLLLPTDCHPLPSHLRNQQTTKQHHPKNLRKPTHCIHHQPSRPKAKSNVCVVFSLSLFSVQCLTIIIRHTNSIICTLPGGRFHFHSVSLSLFHTKTQSRLGVCLSVWVSMVNTPAVCTSLWLNTSGSTTPLSPLPPTAIST